MSGYRQSSYDPEAAVIGGKPLRPFNRWQWLGVGFAIASLAIDLAYFGGRLGWIRPVIDSPVLAVAFLGPAIALINSRREPPHDTTPEQHAANRRMLIITAFICAAILGIGAILEFSGA